MHVSEMLPNGLDAMGTRLAMGARLAAQFEIATRSTPTASTPRSTTSARRGHERPDPSVQTDRHAAGAALDTSKGPSPFLTQSPDGSEGQDTSSLAVGARP